jgi:hypothetical protein
MSTRSHIGLVYLDGSVEVIYCHFDGYPSNNGAILLENYNDVDKAQALVLKGDASYIGPTLDECKFYNENQINQKFISLDVYGKEISKDIFIEFCYLYNVKEYKWIWSAGNGKFKDLTSEDVNEN